MSETHALCICPTSSTGKPSAYDRYWKWEKSVFFLRLKYGYFSYENAWICYMRPLFTPRSEAHFIMDVSTLFDDLWTVEQKHPLTAMIELGIPRIIFYITPI